MELLSAWCSLGTSCYSWLNFCWENSHGTEFEWEEESGDFGRGEDRIDSAAVFLAGWIAVAGADLGNGGASGAGADAEGEVEGTRGHRQLGGGEGRGHYFSLREAAGGGGRGAGNSRPLEWEAVGDFGGGIGSDGDDGAGDAEYSLRAGRGNDGSVQGEVRDQAASGNGDEVFRFGGADGGRGRKTYGRSHGIVGERTGVYLHHSGIAGGGGSKGGAAARYRDAPGGSNNDGRSAGGAGDRRSSGAAEGCGDDAGGMHD